MTDKPLFRLPYSFALCRVLLSLLPALLLTVSFTSPSLAQEPVFSNDGMRWEGEAMTEVKAAANEFDQDDSVLALDAAHNLEVHSQLILPEPDADEIARRMTPTDDADRRPEQTGFSRAVAGFAQLPPSPAGTQRGSDGRDYAVSQRLVGSAGAASIRLHFSDVLLPAGARLYVYSLADSGEQPKGYDNAWLGARTSFWSHTIPGDRAVVEYHIPLEHGTKGRPADSYTVNRVVHNVVDIFGRQDGATASHDTCHLDMCEHPAWRDIGDSVVLLTYIRENGYDSGRCSGSLLNDRAGSGTPYIYTANHCISTQRVASTVEIWYFYQRNLCSDDPHGNRERRMGTTLLATGEMLFGNGDSTLLRADETPPNGVMLLGWTTADIAVGASVTGIHHSRGAPKRIAFGNKIGDDTFDQMHDIEWLSGHTEPGASGSPLIINGPPGGVNARVVGSLAATTNASYCVRPTAINYYGMFSEAWPSFQPFLDNSLVPDLIVDGVSVADTTPAPGASFTINATARNQGAGAAAATTLRYFRSDDATITAADTQLATTPVSALATDAALQQSATVLIADAGSYWVGACVDTVNRETETGNNCSTAVQVTVTAPALPDLSVGNVSVSNITPAPGATFTINATVRNSGTGAAAATTLHYYRSNDKTIGRTDTELTTDAVDGLASGGSSSESAPVSIANTGVYWVGACAAMVNGETATDNNCSSGVQVTVTAGPDLTVDGISVAESSVEASVAFTINATVQNQGTGAAVATTLRYYGSDDSTITVSDTELASEPVATLAADASSQQSAEVLLTDVGAWWVGACVVEVNDEIVTDNNCSAGVQVTVTVPPDNNDAILLTIIHLLLDP